MTDTLLELFLPIIIGYILVKIRYLDVCISHYIKLFVIRVTVPCLTFISMYNSDLGTIKQILPLSLSFVFMTLFLILFSHVLFSRIKDRRIAAAYIITISIANYGYMGWAVLEGALGVEGLTRGVFFITLWWPGIYAGTFLIGKLSKIESNLEIKNFLINIITPTTVLVIGIACNLLNITLYNPLLNTFNVFGNMTATLILFSVGLTISISDSIKAFKIAIIPVILRPILGLTAGFIAVLLFSISDPISKSSVLIESMMPSAVLTVILGDMLGLDGKLISSILVLSTLLSLVTIPISLYLFN